MSDNKGLYKALLKYQQKNITVSRDGINPHFKSKYATLEHINKTVTHPLNECGLLLTQEPHTNAEGLVTVVTRLVHADTGENISCDPSCSTDGTAQKVGSAITYLRRYGYSLVGLVTDDDDDGNTASEKGKKESSGKTKEENKEDGMRKKIREVCRTVAEGDREKAGGVLFELTEWKDDDGKIKREGIRKSDDLSKFKGKVLGAIYAKAKESLEAWEGSSGKVESADDDGSTYDPETGQYEF